MSLNLLLFREQNKMPFGDFGSSKYPSERTRATIVSAISSNVFLPSWSESWTLLTMTIPHIMQADDVGINAGSLPSIDFKVFLM